MSERSEQLRDELAGRLERVRGDLTEDQFARLVADVVSTAQRFEEIDARERQRKTPVPGALPVAREPDARL